MSRICRHPELPVDSGNACRVNQRCGAPFPVAAPADFENERRGSSRRCACTQAGSKEYRARVRFDSGIRASLTPGWAVNLSICWQSLQEIGQLCMTVFSCKVCGSEPVFIPEMGPGAGSEQEVNHSAVPVLRGEHERGGTGRRHFSLRGEDCIVRLMAVLQHGFNIREKSSPSGTHEQGFSAGCVLGG